MKKKIVSILVSMLLCVTVVSVTGAMNIEKTVSVMPQSVSTDVVWSDNFDSYALGSSMHGQGGWKGWDNDPTWTAYVTDVQSLSSPHSVDIVGDSDLVHEFSEFTSGNWTFTARQYIPTDFSGTSYFILLDDYTDGAGQANHWAVQLHFNSTTQLVESEFDALTLPLITGQWVEIRVEIDFDIDWLECYYDDDLLVEKAWTAGISNNGDGYLVLDAVDLFANGATSVYYDDLSIEGDVGADPDLDCDGDLSWINVSTGEELTGSFTVSNIGGSGSLLGWEITKSPSWGTWTFDPEDEDDLTPEDSPVTVQVTVVAPEDKNEEFSGRVTIENKEDPSDICYIDVYLSTPKNKGLPKTPIQGSFEAELGRRGNNEPLIYLNGSYHSRDRAIIVGGTATAGERQWRFKGIFRGNHFIIRTPVSGRVLTILGRCSFDEEHQEFTGVWMGRGIPVRGWITGIFTPAE